MDFKELKRLWDLGFALHWIKPKSKVPVKSGWTKGPRDSWETLKKDYRKGYNVGVRLGSASKIGDKFLAVIDVDVKSDDLRHTHEANEKLKELFLNLGKPSVMSGRGNGSRHYYVLLTRPISGSERKGQSSETVKVLMPGERISKREQESLSTKEIGAGIRLRPAWEISVMSEGRQVVLPPSIHPDTGHRYIWGLGKPENDRLPFIEVTSTASKAVEKPTLEVDHGFLDLEAEALGLDPSQVEELEGKGGATDRSALAFSLCLSLLKKGVGDKEIVSLLTDKKYWLGEMPFDHAKTKSRKVAAKWFRRYCLEPAKKKLNESVFDDVEVLEGEEKKKGEDSWRNKLDLNQYKKLRATLKNVLLILQNLVSPNIFVRNQFLNNDFFGCDTPWGTKKGKIVTDDDAVDVKIWLSQNFKIEPPTGVIQDAISAIARENGFHPVKTYLESLKWDGVSRIEKAFKTYLNADMPEPYLSAVSRKFFLALITRIYEPGCKFDHIPVLEGSQGIGKSTFGRMLVGGDWFMDGLPDLGDKDAALNLQGVWLIEMSELSSLQRTQIDQAKAFITRQVDKVRPPYGRRKEEIPRACVFVGTTNSDDYLTDRTGNRRFWPIKVHGCKFKALQRDRDQLFAEAKFIYDFAKEPLYFEKKLVKLQAEEIQDSRKPENAEDAMQSQFLQWVQKETKENSEAFKKFYMHELFVSGPFSTYPRTDYVIKAIAKILRDAGYKRGHTRSGNLWTCV